MKDIRIILPNPASDTAGAASMLFQLGGLSIIHDAAGSMESYITFDESRELTGKRTVASRLSRLEAITGNDSTLLNKIETECGYLFMNFSLSDINTGTPINPWPDLLL